MPPPSHDADRINPPSELTSEAAKGFFTGVARFGSISLLTHLALTSFHPVYRNLTIQFKVFMQMSAMTLGGCIWAEKRVTEYNDMVRRRRRAMERSERAWRESEEVQSMVQKKG